ncbi:MULTISPECIES: histidine kinase N-terminal 7TM domain-containing protein [Haloferax]|uniref:histidine kinase n=1 Tax=Haloferax marinum TaxID=2666143 RepID=A0A6A8G5M9_9EURY|nr:MULTISPECIES: histidine kinase N-terminal 7TM domain-containing protein [Haloferax]KAB1196570.1 PAS domain S-box protein [Haloferax sp. CBA1150]MRW95573.1 PAS domain S-box protein [Haloferax marinum]
MTAPDQLPYVYALFTAGILSGIVAIVVLGRFRLYSRRVRLPFALLSLSAAIWATAYGFSLLATTASTELFYSRLAWVGAVSLPSIWLVFSLVYAGEDQHVTRQALSLLTVEPAVAIALGLTNQYHGLFVPATVLQTGISESLAAGGTPLFSLHIVYTGGISIAGLSVLAKATLNSSGVHRQQAALLTIMGGIPSVSFAMTVFFQPVIPVDPTPVSFALSSTVVLWALVRYRLFDITPVARDAILSEMRDAVVVLDSYDRVVETNEAAADLLEYPPGECIGQPVLDVVRQTASVRTVLEERDRIETILEDGDSRRYFEIRCSPIAEQTKNRAKLLVFHDVTERRQTEEEFRALIENSRDIITVLDEAGVRKYTSPSMEDVLGFTQEELVEQPALDLVHPDDRERVQRRLSEVVDGDDPVRTECRVRHTNGSWRWFETVGVNLLDDPAIEGLVLNSRDVTNRYRYEQRLRVLNRVLRHDLRNDMNVILGHADLLLDERIPAEAKDHATTIKRKAHSLVELGEQTRQIDTTLDRQSSDLSPVELVERIDAQLDDIESNYPRAIISRDLPDEQWVYADDLVESALKNLLENALEHNDRILPEVCVTIDETPVSTDFVEVRISDNGPGIPDAELAVLESGTETPLQHISGLGLWLVHWIIDRSNGRLHFTENEPRGTTATVRLKEYEQSLSSGRQAPAETQTD